MAATLPEQMPSRWLDQIRLRSDIRAIAEGHAMLNDKLDGFQAEVRREFRRVDRRLLRLEARR